MAFFNKKQKENEVIKEDTKKVKEPAYYTSATNLPTINYKVYYMSFKEKVLYFLLAAIVGGAAAYLFYGGIGKDEFGNPTRLTYILNISIPFIVGLLSGKFFLPIRTQQIIEARNKKLKSQFRDFLDGITTSLGAGNNMNDSIFAVYDDLKIQYEEEAYIIKEMEIIIKGLQNNIPLDDMLFDFAKRSGNTDIKSFAEVFNVCYRKGGDMKEVVRNTHLVLREKLDIIEDIETMVSSTKMEQSIMIVMPVVLVGMIKSMSPEFAENFSSPSGIIATTVAVICFVAAYYLGKVILDIKI